MKLIDAILNVQRPESAAYEHNVGAEAVTASLGISGFYYFPEELDARFKAYPIFEWLCTDTHVGFYALYMDGEAVGYTYQSARKSDKEVYWLSTEAANKVRAIILTYMETPEEYNIIDNDLEIPEYYSISYASQALADHGLYDGQPVRAIFWYNDRTTPVEYRREGRSYYVAAKYGDDHYGNVVVEDEMGTRLEIPVTEFRIKINVDMEKVNA